MKAKKPISRIKKTPLAKLMRDADKLAGEVCRQRGVCESCGSKQLAMLQWSHIISRTYKGLRWDMENCLCLCRVCHARFTYRPSQWIAWLMENFPVKYLMLERKSREIHKPVRLEMEQVIKDLKEKLA